MFYVFSKTNVLTVSPKIVSKPFSPMKPMNGLEQYVLEDKIMSLHAHLHTEL